MLLTILPINKKIQVDKGENLYDSVRDHGVDLGVCSGNKTCGKCKVLITKGNVSPLLKEEIDCLSPEEISRGIRLACCLNIVEDTTVILVNEIDLAKASISSQEAVIRTHPMDDRCEYGVAFDIGTTTVEGMLWNISKQICLATVQALNPQNIYGKDVISRITYSAASKSNLERLSREIQTCCNTLIKEMINKASILPTSIKRVVIAANTTMTQLFCGNDLEGLGVVPIRNVNYDGREYLASDVNMPIAKNAKVYVMPCIGGHVGSDTLGCIINHHVLEKESPFLLIDIGTNGEIVLGMDGEYVVCSTAAGPAFEGASLSYGMGAREGAITKAHLENDRFILKYIGDDKKECLPLGICGSGVVEVIYELLHHNKMDYTGRLLGEYGVKNYVTLYKEKQREVLLTQKDIREIQLAKAAIYAGAMIILKEHHLTVQGIERLYIAGGFGSNLNIDKAIGIGLIPRIESKRVQLIGNGSLQGATSILLGNIRKETIDKIKSQCKHIDLALNKDFQDEFINAISFH